MDKIASFRINHLVLQPGIYVSRRDTTPSGDVLTTFDIRMTAPNREPAADPRALHTIEHLAATWLRNNAEWRDRVVYWGPMGCCTGSYLILQGNLESEDIVPLMREMFRFIASSRAIFPELRLATAATIPSTTCRLHAPWQHDSCKSLTI